MSFSFEHDDDSVVAGVRRIALAQIDGALDESRASDVELGEVVHRLRRRCKKLRGLLRLIEPSFKGFADENRTFRDAAARLSGARDAAVVVQTFDTLVKFDEKRDEPVIEGDLHNRLRAELAGRHGAHVSDAAAAAMLEQFRAIMEAARGRVGGWKLRAKGFDALEPGLRETYQRLRWRLKAALEDPTAERCHEWRKETKYHWHHVNLLSAGAPDVLKGRRQLLDELGELLGDHHNLAVLGDLLTGDKVIVGLGDPAPVRALAAERQDKLVGKAFDLGLQLTAEKPRALSARFGRYWTLMERA